MLKYRECYETFPPGYRERAIQRAIFLGVLDREYPDLIHAFIDLIYDDGKSIHMHPFWTEVYFSKVNNKELPTLPKYEY